MVVDGRLNVGERDETSHPKVWWRQPFRKRDIAIVQGEIAVASGLGAQWILREEQERESNGLDGIYSWWVHLHF